MPRSRAASRRRDWLRGVSLGDVTTTDENAQLASGTDPVGSVITCIENPST